jgi:hypothetical protein
MSFWHVGLLTAASWFVPKGQRAEWLAEWQGELWHVESGATIFCLGSFRDAAWLRRNNPEPPAQGSCRLESPVRCLLLMATVAVASLLFTLRLPQGPVRTAIADSFPRPAGYNFLVVIGMSCLILPVITSFSLGEYPGGKYRLRRWSFLLAKIGLILTVLYAGCLYVNYQYLAHPCSPAPVYALLLGCILAFRWVLNDQRRRCPVCLRALGHAAQVGQPARNFLEWNGTELMCGRGHGLLHIPATPADWSGRQRWVELDASWSGLFRSAPMKTRCR